MKLENKSCTLHFAHSNSKTRIRKQNKEKRGTST
jgi:hypothetical protein